MKVLAIETATMLGGVAVADAALGLVAETRLNVKTTHSERLMTAIHHTLLQADLTLNDIDAFAVSIGPGSFTGLRIGLSTAKGLVYATGRPMVTVPTLEAFAWNFPASAASVCLMLDARKKEVYAALFRWEGEGFEKILGETTLRPEDFLRRLEGPAIFAGDGVAIYRPVIEEMLGKRAIFAPPGAMVPSPANVAMLGLSRALRAEFADPVATVPFYLRKSEAELKWTGKG